MSTWALVILIALGSSLLIVVLFQIPSRNRLIRDATKKDISKLQAWIARGVDINKRDWLGQTAMGEAITKRRIENVRLLLDCGADPNRKSIILLPLEEAIDADSLEIAKMLLDKGADPDLPGSFRISPLENAIDEGKADFVQLFIDYGANINRKCSFGEPLLIILLWRIVRSRKERKKAPLRQVLQIMLNHGANLHVRSKHDVPAVVLAMRDPVALRMMVDAGVITEISYEGTHLKPIIEGILEDSEA